MPWPLWVVLALLATTLGMCERGPLFPAAPPRPGGAGAADDFVPGAAAPLPSAVKEGVPLPSPTAAPSRRAVPTVGPSGPVAAARDGRPMGGGWYQLGPDVRVSVPGARSEGGRLLVDVRVFNDRNNVFAVASMSVDVPLTTGGASPCSLRATDADGKRLLVVEVPARSGMTLTYRCPVGAGTAATVQVRLHGRDPVTFLGDVPVVAVTSGPGQPVPAPTLTGASGPVPSALP